MLAFLNAAALLFALHLRRSQGHHVLTARLLSLALGLAFICGTAANCANGVHVVLLILSILGMGFSCAAVICVLLMQIGVLLAGGLLRLIKTPEEVFAMFLTFPLPAV